MTWYAIYRDSDGELISLGTVIAPDKDLARKGFVKRALAYDPRVRTKQWNVSTKDFDDVTPPRGAISTKEFLERFEDAEYEAMVKAARSSVDSALQDAAEALLAHLNVVSDVDLESGRIVKPITQLETSGLLKRGRAAAILA